MAEISFDDGKLRVLLEDSDDVAQLRVSLKAADGADEGLQFGRNSVVTLDHLNPFNFIALEFTDFHWSSEALRTALECLAPIARSSLSIHSRSSAQLMKRRLKGFPGKPGDTNNDA